MFIKFSGVFHANSDQNKSGNFIYGNLMITNVINNIYFILQKHALRFVCLQLLFINNKKIKKYKITV